MKSTGNRSPHLTLRGVNRPPPLAPSGRIASIGNVTVHPLNNKSVRNKHRPRTSNLSLTPHYNKSPTSQHTTMPITEGAPRHGNPAHLLPPSWRKHITLWLEEDT